MDSSEYSIYERGYKFSLSVVCLCKTVTPDIINRNMISQVLRSATSISANLQEANSGISRKDFISKITISLKEARETRYWLQLLSDSGYTSTALAQPLIQECIEISRILGAIKTNTQVNSI